MDPPGKDENQCFCGKMTPADKEPFPFNIDIKNTQSLLNITKFQEDVSHQRIHRVYNTGLSFDNVANSKELILRENPVSDMLCRTCQVNDETKGKKTMWIKAKKYFNFKRNKKTNICDDEICSDLDPVYHILLNGASQNWNKLISGQSPEGSLNGKCHDISCPCNDPKRIPIITKEDIGQQAKRELSNSLKRCQSTNLRNYLTSSNSTYSISSNFSR